MVFIILKNILLRVLVQIAVTAIGNSQNSSHISSPWGGRGGRGEGYEDFVVSRQNLPDPPEGSLIFLGSPPSLVVNFTKIPLFVCNILLAATDLSFRSLRKIGDPTLSSEPLSPDENDD